MADEKQAPRKQEQEGKEKRHDDLELPEETAEQVKGGSWDIKKDS
jgi:hypothetical protein